MQRTAGSIMLAVALMLTAASCPPRKSEPQQSPCNLGEHCLQTGVQPAPSITPAP